MNCPAMPLLVKSKNPCAIKIRCPAKINLYLNILGTYPNGFHRIETIVNRINLCDELTIRRTKDRSVSLRCNVPDLENADNLCVKAAHALRRKGKMRGGVEITLTKRIPHGAGLGGGSSDAAATLWGMNVLFGLGLKQQDLYRLGARLGSDINFFLSGCSFARLWGRGEKVEPLHLKRRLDYLIVFCGRSLSTQKIYRMTKVKLTKFLDNANIIYHALKHRDTTLLRRSVFNALEAGSFACSEELRKRKDLLKKRGFIMSGSGSAFFTLIDRAADYEKLKKMMPRSWKAYRVRGL